MFMMIPVWLHRACTYVFVHFAHMVTLVVQSSTPSKNEMAFHALFVGALAGDRRAVSALLSAVAALAKRYVARKITQPTDADDVVQEILISVHKALHTYDPARPCMPWLASVMHYRVSDWLRSRYRAGTRLHVPLEDVEEFLQADVTEEPWAREYLNKAVASLPDGQRAVIHAMYHQDMSVAEASEALGMNVSAVKVTAHRAYKKLRARLGVDE
jgi:RNA polymerase sigma-70 factor, ECF subfamily